MGPVLRLAFQLPDTQVLLTDQLNQVLMKVRAVIGRVGSLQLGDALGMDDHEVHIVVSREVSQNIEKPYQTIDLSRSVPQAPESDP